MDSAPEERVRGRSNVYLQFYQRITSRFDRRVADLLQLYGEIVMSFV